MHLGLLEQMPKSGVQRRRIMDFVYSLRDSPYTPGDFSDKDAFAANASGKAYRRLCDHLLGRQPS